MKNFYNLFIAQLKRISKDINILGFFIGMPVIIFIMIGIINYLNSDAKEKTTKYTIQLDNISYVVKDKGNLWENFFSGGKKIEDIKAAEEDLLKSKIAGVIIIPEDFSEKLKMGQKPQLEIIKLSNGNSMHLILNALNTSINNYLINNFLQAEFNSDKNMMGGSNIKIKTMREKNVVAQFALKIVTLLILYIIVFGASPIATDLIKLRESKMLERTIISPNSEFMIIGTLLFSFVVLQVLVNILCFFGYAFGFNIKIAGFGIIIVTIFSASVFALSLAIVVARIFKKQEQLNLATTVITVVIIIFFFVAFLNVMDGIIEAPSIIKKMAVISPLYWLVEMLDKEKIFPNIIIVWLMIVVLITAGSWKLKQFNSAE